MSANTSITEGGKARPFGPVNALMVQGSDGKYYPWYPESERQLDTLSVTKNGVYQAKKLGVYGWRSVSVNVPTSGSVTGKDPVTGQEVTVTADPETGEIVQTVAPVEIRVITPPTNPYGTYVDGQTIGTDGMVVKAYDSKGNELLTVPLGQITINPTVAVFDPEKDNKEGIAEYDGMSCPYASAANTYFAFGATEGEKANNTYGFPSVSGSAPVYGVRCNDVNYLVSAGPFSGTYRGYGGNVVPIEGSEYNGGYIASMGSSAGDWYPNIEYVPSKSGLSIADAVDCILLGTLGPIKPGSPQTITVSWPRTGDGVILETSFDILVGPRGGGGED